MTCKHQSITYPQNTASLRLPIREILKGFLGMLKHWRQRSRSRRALAELDERLLQDVGLTASDAYNECSLPFWRSGGGQRKN